MPQKQGRDFLIRNMPVEVYSRLEKSAKDHHRSKTQEAIVVLTEGLASPSHHLKQPKPFKWKTEVSDKFIEDAIREGRD